MPLTQGLSLSPWSQREHVCLSVFSSRQPLYFTLLYFLSSQHNQLSQPPDARSSMDGLKAAYSCHFIDCGATLRSLCPGQHRSIFSSPMRSRFSAARSLRQYRCGAHQVRSLLDGILRCLSYGVIPVLSTSGAPISIRPWMVSTVPVGLDYSSLQPLTLAFRIYTLGITL